MNNKAVERFLCGEIERLLNALEHIETEPNMEWKLYAGLDSDMIAKLFFVNKRGETIHVQRSSWLAILDRLDAKPGEMLVVSLSRDVKNEKEGV